jgi:flagellar biosynthesis protein FlhF
MQVKRYEVSSMNEALTKIKADMGPEAIILSAKKMNGMGRPGIEVLAARDENVQLPKRNLVSSLPPDNSRLMESNEDVYKFFKNEINELKEIIRSQEKERSLNRELAELKETMDRFFDILGARKGKYDRNINQKVYYQLLACGFSRASACSIVEAIVPRIALPDQVSFEEIAGIIEGYIAKTIPAGNGKFKEEKRIKAYVGATGVGKTTTLAKLAARYSLIKKKSVGLVTIDTFRISATEQLRTYAKIMGIRMEVASTKESFQKSLQLLSDKDIILIDTPGRSRVDDGGFSLVDAVIQNGGIETNLLVSTTASEDNLNDIIKKYSAFNYDNLIVTKIDETSRFGILYDVINRARKPVSYLTCGQNIPQDIEEVTPQKVASLMVRNIVH